MPTYEHSCNKCNHTWEDFYKMSDPVPSRCPKCKKNNCVKRLISGCTVKVELSGRELFNKNWQEGKKMLRDAQKDENLAANLVGEEKYHKQELARNKK